MPRSVVIAGGGGDFRTIAHAVRRSVNHFRVVRVVSGVRKCLAIVRRCRPEIFLLGVTVPDDEVFMLIQRVSRELPTRVVVMCGRQHAGSAVEALHAGAADYILTGTSEDDIVRRLQSALV